MCNPMFVWTLKDSPRKMLENFEHVRWHWVRFMLKECRRKTKFLQVESCKIFWKYLNTLEPQAFFIFHRRISTDLFVFCEMCSPVHRHVQTFGRWVKCPPHTKKVNMFEVFITFWVFTAHRRNIPLDVHLDLSWMCTDEKKLLQVEICKSF